MESDQIFFEHDFGDLDFPQLAQIILCKTKSFDFNAKNKLTPKKYAQDKKNEKYKKNNPQFENTEILVEELFSRKCFLSDFTKSQITKRLLGKKPVSADLRNKVL